MKTSRWFQAVSAIAAAALLLAAGAAAAQTFTVAVVPDTQN